MTPKEAARKDKARALALNPCPGRSPKQYQRVLRALLQVAARIRWHLEYSDYAAQPWLPFDSVVNSNDDQWQRDLYAQVQEGSYRIDDHGHMLDFSDQDIRATNRIVAVSWYTNEQQQSFIIKKPVLSPLPCDQWGRLPATLRQWERVASTYVEAEQLWRWVHAVRQYTDDETFEPAGIAGWHMELAQQTVSFKDLAAAGKGYIIDTRSIEDRRQDSLGWVGANICLDITGAFSLDDGDK